MESGSEPKTLFVQCLTNPMPAHTYECFSTGTNPGESKASVLPTQCLHTLINASAQGQTQVNRRPVFYQPNACTHLWMLQHRDKPRWTEGQTQCCIIITWCWLWEMTIKVTQTSHVSGQHIKHYVNGTDTNFWRKWRWLRPIMCQVNTSKSTSLALTMTWWRMTLKVAHTNWVRLTHQRVHHWHWQWHDEEWHWRRPTATESG